jgi:eukaryotic-like serine/threonine-protein kinase
MNPDKWKKIESICYEAMDLHGVKLDTYLLNSCGDDKEVLKEVKSLLKQAQTEFPIRPFATARFSDIFSGKPNVSERFIGPYRLIRELASGGMGQIFLAVRDDDQFERFVALKVIRKDLIDKRILNRFYEERRILASLNHRYIARLFDGGTTDDGIPWFAMEYIEGEPITDFAAHRNLPVMEIIRLFLKVCDAVQYAHQNLVIHRDLKPENILITPDGDPRLLDFGIAKLLSADQIEGQTQYQNRIMTPEYASPEQVGHESVSTVSDVYSLGVLLYRLTTGALPYTFEKRSPASIERTIRETGPELPSITSGLKSLKGDLDSVIMKALKKDPSERYASVEQLSNDLTRYVQYHPVLAGKDSILHRAKKFTSRNRWTVSVSAAIVLMVLSFSVITFVQSKAIQARAIEAEQQRDRAEQVSSFLTNLFNSVNPDEAENNALSAIDLLHRGAKRVDNELADQPELQASLYLVISDVYEKLGMFDAGLSLAEKAYQINIELYGDVHPETARSLNAIGWLHRQNADYELADSLITAALQLRRGIHGSNHPDVARSLNDLAVLKQSRGDYAAADTLLLESITIRQTLANTPNEALGVALSNHAALKYSLGDFEAAESQMKEALAIFLETAGTSDMRTANVMSNLAAILMVRNKMEEAIDYYEQALVVRSGILSPEHPDIASSYAHLGNLYRRTGRLDEAERYLTRALNLREGSLGEEHELIFDTKRLLGLLYDNMGNDGEAENYYSEAIEGFLRLNPTGHIEAAETLHNLGSLYLRKINPRKAEPYLRHALEMRERILGINHELTLRTLVSLGTCSAELNDHDRSRLLLYSALARLDESGLDSPELRSLAVNTLSDLENVSRQ